MNRLVISILFVVLYTSSCTHKQSHTENGKNTLVNQATHFDEIIFSTSECMIPCPMTNIIISADGLVVFKGQGNSAKIGLYSGKISKELYQQIEKNFEKANIDGIKNRYQTLLSDQRTVSTTFVKNGRIYKTVYDYGEIAPKSFQSSYEPLENLYKTLNLTKDPVPKLIPLFDEITTAKLKKGNMVFDLTQSETFLLTNYLRKGKLTINNFLPCFTLHFDYGAINPLYNVDTDGRFFKFLVKSKPVIIDIGFNFYDVNAKNWQWRKATKFD